MKPLELVVNNEAPDILNSDRFRIKNASEMNEDSIKALEATGILDRDEYEIKKYIGRGTWGDVYEAVDNKTGKTRALKFLNPDEVAKRQMQERNLDLADVINKDFVDTIDANLPNIVPRSLVQYEDNIGFIDMPFYETFLDKVIDRYREGDWKESRVSANKIHYILSEIAAGIEQSHTELVSYRIDEDGEVKQVIGRVHGDLKPDNIAIANNGKALLNDFGASTCAAAGMSISPRDNIGFEYTRAPEQFREGSHPTKQSDVWAFGSLMYRMLTGEYLLENELDNAKDPELFMNNLDEGVYNAMLKTKLKKAPKRYRKFMKRALAFNRLSRFDNGNDLKRSYKKMLKKMETPSIVEDYIKKGIKFVAIPLAAVAIISYNATHMKDFDIPKINTYKAMSLMGHEKRTPINFQREDVKYDNTSNVTTHADMQFNAYTHVTDNAYVGYMLAAYDKAVRQFGLLKTPLYTDYQYKAMMNTTTGAERKMYRGELLPVAKSIEIAMNLHTDGDNNIDLEDMCVSARLGPNILEQARKHSGSINFNDYIVAKKEDGSYIIPKKEQGFIKNWLKYIKTE
jgi:serine/threonine protein kinase